MEPDGTTTLLQATFSVSKATLIDNRFQTHSKYIVLFVLILIASKMAQWQCGHWCDTFQECKSTLPVNLYINRPCHYLRYIIQLLIYLTLPFFLPSHAPSLLLYCMSNYLSLSHFQLLLPSVPKFYASVFIAQKTSITL